MKKFVTQLLMTLICVVLIITMLTGFIIFTCPDAFDGLYSSVIQRKFDTLVQTDEPKIIVVGGSNATFGINEELIEKKIGYKVANLALHAGMGGVVPTELSKANINQGDIVLLAYEWGWPAEAYFDSFGTDLVMTGFADRLDMYKYIPEKFYPRLIGYLFEYAEKKCAPGKSGGVYSPDAFDAAGRLIFERTGSAFDGNSTILVPETIADDTALYLKEYKQYVLDQGAQICFIAPVCLDAAMKSEWEEYRLFAEYTSQKLEIDYICDPTDYFFPLELMYDTAYHCNSKGEIKRTELLIRDLVDAGLVEVKD